VSEGFEDAGPKAFAAAGALIHFKIQGHPGSAVIAAFVIPFLAEG
jgi:hypothetical protein